MAEDSGLALIAGAGRLPLLLAGCARRSGRRVHAVALRGLSDPGLAAEADSWSELHLGEFVRVLDALARTGASEVALAGKVPKAFLWKQRELVRPDERALAFLSALRDRRDDTLLGALAELLEGEGYAVASQLEVASELVAAAGFIAGREPTPAEWSDIAFGWPIAAALGALDVGQTVVVQGRAVLALEAIEGTDAAVARGLCYAERGRSACVVKVAKPHQDVRFDVPTVGPDTLRTIAAGGGSALAVEAGRTLVLERAELAREAERAGLAVVGVVPGSLSA